MTAPRQMTASYCPDSAIFLAMRGISNDPGTDATVTSSSRTPCLLNAAFAPSSRRDVMKSLNVAQTMPTRSPSPLSEP